MKQLLMQPVDTFFFRNHVPAQSTGRYEVLISIKSVILKSSQRAVIMS